MTRKTRYFVVGAAAVLIVGLGGGLVAYLSYQRSAALPDGVPAEIRYVPANVELIAYADVRAVMNSELRKQLMPTLEGRSHKGHRMMTDFAGVDLEKQVHRVLVYVEPSDPAEPQAENRKIPRAAVLVTGTFDLPRIEQAVRDRAGEFSEYKGRKLLVHRDGAEAFAVGLMAPDLIALGQADVVRRVIDLSVEKPGPAGNITDNQEVMRLIRDAAGSTAWVVGHFDAVRRHMKLSAEMGSKVPPLRLVSAKANVNGGIRATVRAEAGDEAAAQELRDAVRGFVSLARLHSGGKAGLDSTLKSIELSGTDKTVQLSFAMSPETLRMIAPHPPAPPRASRRSPKFTVLHSDGSG